MNGSIIDTNVIIKMLHNDPEAISLLQKVKKAYVSPIIRGELYFGAYKSLRCEANMELFRNTLSKFEMLSLDDDNITLSYAHIKSELEKKGKKIPENDLWIAATAHFYGLSVATFDTHFSYISQIQLVPFSN
ncbi:PIN domain-containing protein [Treponema sp. TIM-1]|uniref:PIN domain-containing protein n=1 Tax=Treponema sp. TIM-1 TaxID=2898417 RepID=UPI0039815C7A